LIASTAAAYMGARKDSTNSQALLENAEKMRLMGFYQAWNENKLNTYLTILGSEDVQRDYYMDRIVMLQMQSLGSQIPPQLYSLVYMKFYLTYLKTMKFSLKYQVLAYFNTLIEDEIDVFSMVVAKEDTAEATLFVESENLVRNRLWFFSGAVNFAQTDLTVFYLQYYLDYMTIMLSGQNTGLPDMWVRMIQLFKTMYNYQGANSGLRAALLEKASVVHEGEDISERELEAALSGYYTFGNCYRLSTSMDYVLGMYDMYSLYASYYAAAQAAQAAAQPVAAAAPI